MSAILKPYQWVIKARSGIQPYSKTVEAKEFAFTNLTRVYEKYLLPSVIHSSDSNMTHVLWGKNNKLCPKITVLQALERMAVISLHCGCVINEVAVIKQLMMCNFANS